MSNVIRVFFIQSLRHGWPAYLVVLAAFFTGVFAGTAGVDRLSHEQSLQLSSVLDRFILQAGSVETAPDKTGTALYDDTVLILSIYILGLSVIGIPVMLGLLFFRGFVLGFAVQFLTREKAAQGIALALAAVFPQNLFLVPALLIGGVASLSFSVLLARRFFNSAIAVWPGFVGYSGLMAVLGALAACAGAVEVYLTPLLIKTVAHYFF
ncbi:MAG: stage II sporulation protein M [Firmicutes bacterium]|nr:stage II sporulation protein M [Bacillota bacterium]